MVSLQQIDQETILGWYMSKCHVEDQNHTIDHVRDILPMFHILDINYDVENDTCIHLKERFKNKLLESQIDVGLTKYVEYFTNLLRKDVNDGSIIAIKIILENLIEQFKTSHINASKHQKKIDESSYTKKVLLFLDENKIRYEREVYDQKCKDQDVLYFDYLLLDYNILIEIDGEQHFKEGCIFNGKLHDYNSQVKRDKIKNKYCIKYNRHFLRISYSMFENNKYRSNIIKMIDDVKCSNKSIQRFIGEEYTVVKDIIDNREDTSLKQNSHLKNVKIVMDYLPELNDNLHVKLIIYHHIGHPQVAIQNRESSFRDHFTNMIDQIKIELKPINPSSKKKGYGGNYIPTSTAEIMGNITSGDKYQDRYQYKSKLRGYLNDTGIKHKPSKILSSIDAWL